MAALGSLLGRGPNQDGPVVHPCAAHLKLIQQNKCNLLRLVILNTVIFLYFTSQSAKGKKLRGCIPCTNHLFFLATLRSTIFRPSLFFVCILASFNRTLFYLKIVFFSDHIHLALCFYFFFSCFVHHLFISFTFSHVLFFS